jgi:peptidoglycan-associated lipoprotein
MQIAMPFIAMLVVLMSCRPIHHGRVPMPPPIVERIQGIQPSKQPPVERSTPIAPAAVKQSQPDSITPPVSHAPRMTIEQAQSSLRDAFFDYDQYTLRADAIAALQSNAAILAALLGSHPGITVIIEGHADERGSAEYNLALADRRARTALDYLMALSIPAGALRPISHGREKPQCSEPVESCWQRNRRAHLALQVPR